MNNIFLKQLYSSCNSPPKKVRRPLNYQQKNIDDYYRSRGRTQPRRVAFSNNFVATWRYRNLYMHLGIISITFTAKPKVTDARKQQQCFNLFLSLIYSCAERLVESGVVFLTSRQKSHPFGKIDAAATARGPMQSTYSCICIESTCGTPDFFGRICLTNRPINENLGKTWTDFNSWGGTSATAVLVVCWKETHIPNLHIFWVPS